MAKTADHDQARTPTTLLALIIALALIALIAVGLKACAGSDSKPAPSASSSAAPSGPNQQNGPTTDAAPTGSASGETTKPYASLASGQYSTVTRASDEFVRAWATKYGNASKRREALGALASNQLADLSQYTDETRLPDVSKVGKGSLDKGHSTNTTPVVKYTISGETWWVLMQQPGERDTTARGDWIASQIVQDKDFRMLYNTITPNPESTSGD